MVGLLGRLIQRFRPVEGWAPFLLLLVASLCPAATVSSSGDQREVMGVVLLTVLGLLIGLRLARSGLSTRAIVLLAGLLGIGLIVVYVAQPVPPWALLRQEALYSAQWLHNWRQGSPGWPLPLARTTQFAGQQLIALGSRLGSWIQMVGSGGQAQDQLVVFLVVDCLAWGITVFATWQIYRRRAAVLGLAPGAVAMTLLAFFRGGIANFYLMVYFFCAAWLVALCHLWRSTARWQGKGTDYPGDLGVELLLSFSPFLVLVFVAAALFPVIYPSQIRDGFWKIMDAPWSRIEKAAEQVIGPFEGASPGGARRGAASGELPRIHLLGGRAELADTVVLYVRTSDPLPPAPSPNQDADLAPAGPRRYWRADTWDTYTGFGWTNGPLESEPRAANQLLEEGQAPEPGLLQQFERRVPGDNRLYAVNSPVRVDQPVLGWWRAVGDLAFLTSDATVYTVISFAPEPTGAEMREVSPLTITLPSELEERYLALPDSVSQRVLDLARSVAGDATTHYDRARAIESYLRTYVYNLDIPAPPDDRDLVDYFLFELQEGYCDYYASAMVVMARSVGVPARLASGYVQGTYDHENQRWVVTEQEGHSWVEVYFDGLGWVEFEPTAGQPALVRPGTQHETTISPPPLPPRQRPGWKPIPWPLAAVGAVLAGLLTLIVLLWRRQPALAAAQIVRDRHERLIRWGRRLGQPPGQGQTVREYGQALARALEVRGQGARLSRTQQAGTRAPSEIETLVKAVEQTEYSARSISDREAGQVRVLWARLRGNLWWLWLAAKQRTANLDSAQTEDQREP